MPLSSMMVVVRRGGVLVVLHGSRQDHGQLGEHVALLLLGHGGCHVVVRMRVVSVVGVGGCVVAEGGGLRR